MGKRQERKKLRFKINLMMALTVFFVFGFVACSPYNLTPDDVSHQPSPSKPAGIEAQPRITLTPIPTTPEPDDFNPPNLADLTQPSPSVTPTSECLHQGGEIFDFSFFSDQMGEDFHFKIYLPPCYHVEQKQHYPVLYLLHGLIFNADQWDRIGISNKMDELIAIGQIAPFIIVLPNEARFHPPTTSAFADVITTELISWIDAHYRTYNDRSFRAIGGLSRGAAWAIRIGFTHHELFSKIGAHSLALFEIDGNRLPIWLTDITEEDYPEVFIDIGRGDKEKQSAQAFADELNKHSVSHIWTLFNGGHTEDYWATHLEDYLKWYARDW